MQGKRIEIDMEVVKQLYVNEKKSLIECGRILGCSSTVIKNRLTLMNIECRGNTEWAKGYKFSKEHMEKLKEGRRKYKMSDEQKENIRNRFLGKKLTIGHKKKIGDAHRGRKHPWVNQAGMNNPNWNGGHAESWFEDSIISKCYNIVRVAKRRGDIVKQPCEICGHKKVHAHHDDYRKPLELRWLCQSHHMLFHRNHRLEDYKYILAERDVV